MKIVIDMQGAQSQGSRGRGVGRYSIGLVKAVLRRANGHEIHLVLSGNFPETIEDLKREFKEYLPAERFHIFKPLNKLSPLDSNSHARRSASELFREFYIAKMKPDIVHSTSLFEGFIDDSVSSLKKLETRTLQSATLFDLIPLIHRKPYLENPDYRAWYFNKLDNLRRADLVLAISHSSEREANTELGMGKDTVAYVGTAADGGFKRTKISAEREASLRARLGLKHPFVLYTGGIDHRKNIERLIESYSRLPRSVRDNHQLSIVCSIRDEDRTRLGRLAKKVGLDADELIFTGHVSEDDLVTLYALCQLFVFPSWHEGFGLPVLEAMSCGAPVIAGSLSSLPEIVRIEHAMFNPHDTLSITAKIKQGLTDDSFRKLLKTNSIRNAARFDWDKCAARALRAMESLVEKREAPVYSALQYRPKLAFVSPLPPAKSGIADYSAQLIPELAKYYDIHLFVKDDVNDIEVAEVHGIFPLKKLSELLLTWREYDRIIYHFGNSEHHDSYFAALKVTSGVVVLHDFFLGNILQHMEYRGQESRCWVSAIHDSHGLSGVRELQSPDAVWKFPASFEVFENAKQVIMHSPSTIELARKWYGRLAAEKSSLVPLLRKPSLRAPHSRDSARKLLGFGTEDFIVCSFGHLGPTKLSQDLFDAWTSCDFVQKSTCRLVFVGQNADGDYGESLAKKVRTSKRSKVDITGWVDRELYGAWLAAADVAVQLRSNSRGETSAAVLDCMNHGLPTIVNAVGSMNDLPKGCVMMLPQQAKKLDLVGALETLHQDVDARAKMGKRAARHVASVHNPARCAKTYFDKIEFAYAESCLTTRLLQEIAHLPLSQHEAVQLCEGIASIDSVAPKRLFIDVSEISGGDDNTGIQRVVRNLIVASIEVASCPIFLLRFDASSNVFRYAGHYAHKLLNCSLPAPEEKVVCFTNRDEILFLDLATRAPPERIQVIESLKHLGVKTHCVVYDLLPIKWPAFFVRGGESTHMAWAKWMATCETALCISKSVAEDVHTFLETHAPDSEIQVKSFALGSTLDRTTPAAEREIKGRSGSVDFSIPTFLMVGTLEPRKGHADVLAAFKKVWASGLEANLYIAGKEGWMVDDLVRDIRATSSKNKYLHWAGHISDDELQKLYEDATCLIAASYDEGFGLPLVEASQHGLPIIARDTPVFREVGGKHATYFSDSLELVIEKWLADYELGIHIRSEGILPISWNDSAKSLLKQIGLAKPHGQTEN